MVDKLRTGWRRLGVPTRVVLCLALAIGLGGGVWFAWAQGGGPADADNRAADAAVSGGDENVVSIRWDDLGSNAYVGGPFWCLGAWSDFDAVSEKPDVGRLNVWLDRNILVTNELRCRITYFSL